MAAKKPQAAPEGATECRRKLKTGDQIVLETPKGDVTLAIAEIEAIGEKAVKVKVVAPPTVKVSLPERDAEGEPGQDASAQVPHAAGGPAARALGLSPRKGAPPVGGRRR